MYYRNIWADFLTDEPAAWIARVGEHDMTLDQGTHEDVSISKIVMHPQRHGEQILTCFHHLTQLNSTLLSH